MMGIDSSEFLVIGALALVVIGPRDLPRVMGQAGRWLGKARRMSAHVRAGFDEMVRQADVSATSSSSRATTPASMPVLTLNTRAHETHVILPIMAVTAKPAATQAQADQSSATETSDLRPTANRPLAPSMSSGRMTKVSRPTWQLLTDHDARSADDHKTGRLSPLV